MSFLDDVRKGMDKRALDKVNRELEELRKKEHLFEKGGPKGNEKISIGSGSSISNLKKIAIFIFLLWAITFFVYMGKVANLEAEVEDVAYEKDLKILNLTTVLAETISELDNKTRAETEISTELTDLGELKNILELEIYELEIKIASLETNLTTQSGLVNKYEACIVSSTGFNGSLNECSNY